MENSVKRFAPFTHLDNVLITFLREYFRYHPTFSWSEEPEKRKIEIIEAFSVDDNEGDFFPRLVLKRGNFVLDKSPSFTTYAQNRERLMNFTQEKDKNFAAGSVYALTIMAKEILTARFLAEEILTTIAMYSDKIDESFKVHIQPHYEVMTEQLTSTGLKKDFSSIMLNFAADFVYTVSTNVYPRYDTLKGVDILTATDKIIEKNNKLKIEELKFNTSI